MGNDSSKDICPEQLDDLKSITSFSRGEIRDWYSKFHNDCPGGKMTKEEFMSMYEQLFPNGDPTAFSEHIFKAYDQDENGHIDFREFLCTLSVSQRGSIDEKLRWAFDMYDLDNNGFVTRAEVEEIFKAIYKMKGQIGATAATNIEDATETLFHHLDKNRDEKLSELEFVLGAKQAPEILGLLQNPGEEDSD